MAMPLLAVTGFPSADTSTHSNSCRSPIRLADLNGSIAAENAIIENCGTSKYAIVVVILFIGAQTGFSGGTRCRCRSSRRRIHARACAAMSRLYQFNGRSRRAGATHGHQPATPRGPRPTPGRNSSSPAAVDRGLQSVRAHGAVVVGSARGHPSYLAAYSRESRHGGDVASSPRGARGGGRRGRFGHSYGALGPRAGGERAGDGPGLIHSHPAQHGQTRHHGWQPREFRLGRGARPSNCPQTRATSIPTERISCIRIRCFTAAPSVRAGRWTASG